MAFKPKGVAAESNPRKLAAKFKVMYDIDSWFLGTEGKTLANTGLNLLASFSAAPETINNSIKPQKKAK